MNHPVQHNVRLSASPYFCDENELNGSYIKNPDLDFYRGDGMWVGLIVKTQRLAGLPHRYQGMQLSAKKN